MKLLCMGLGVAAVCPWWSSVNSAVAATNILQVFNFDFGLAPSTPVDPIINLGDTVRWVWASDGIAHTSTAAGQPESWDSGVHTQPFNFDHTFSQLGTFNYYCRLHGFDAGGGQVGGMSGRVTVVPEPGAGGLLLGGLIALCIVLRRNRPWMALRAGCTVSPVSFRPPA